jgi:hypothetical protein
MKNKLFLLSDDGGFRHAGIQTRRMLTETSMLA